MVGLNIIQSLKKLKRKVINKNKKLRIIIKVASSKGKGINDEQFLPHLIL